jgi:serine/threonine-protein kinase
MADRRAPLRWAKVAARMQPGDVVDDRFEIERLAGAGGMGTVYRAVDRRAGRPVALKILHSQVAEQVERFQREAAFLAELVHPGLVAFVAVGVTGEGQPYLAMEWLDGESLSARLGRGPLSVGEAIDLGRRVAAALQVAHARGVVHRDLKPSNLFLPGWELGRVKILDFGIARVFTPGKTITHTGATLGSPGFMSPEQARAARVDLRSDVFSLACVLFCCLTGHPPFTGDALSVMLKTVTEPAPPLSAARPDVPPALEALVQRMLSKSPDARPPDAATVAAELAALSPAPPPPPMLAPPPPMLAPPPAAGPVPIPPVPRSLIRGMVALACLVGVLYLAVMVRACAASLGVLTEAGSAPSGVGTSRRR